MTSRSKPEVGGAPQRAVLAGIVTAAQLQTARECLNAAGVVPRAIVAWLSHNSWSMLSLLAACEERGAVLLPLNWRFTAAELARIVTHAGAGHVLAAPELEGLAAQTRAAATLSPGPAEGVLPGDLLLVYTSGTTGEPKGAMHTAAGMAANIAAAVSAQNLDAASRVLAVLPMFHVGGLCIQTLPALVVGAAVKLMPRFEPEAWFDEVEQWRPTTTLMVPAVMRALIEHPRWARADLSSLAFINSGSQVVPRLLIEAFHARGIPVTQVYGATETGPVSIVLRPEEAIAHAGRAGRAALGVQVKLAPPPRGPQDDSLRNGAPHANVTGTTGTAGAGGIAGIAGAAGAAGLVREGEILLKAANLMRGYHRHAAPSFDAEGWFHTGDLAVLHDDGFYEVVGRSKELIISGGENIHPAEIENLVATRPEVAECAVIGLPDARWGEVPVLVVVLREGMALDEAGLRHHLDGELARFKHPQRVLVRTSLPKTALGKVQRAVLAQQLQR